MLADYADLSIAVPASEQSWQGKSMTRHGHIAVDSLEIAGQPAWAIDGTPADCVNIALYNLLDRQPDVVISGINVGVNAGLSLVWASGTVGACLEGNIAGLPGIALSQQLTPEVYQHWDRTRSFAPDTLARLKDATRTIMPNIWHELVTHPLRGQNATTYNINLPFNLTSPELTHTHMWHSYYGQCFDGEMENGFKHQLRPFERDTSPRADNTVLQAGKVSVSLLDIRSFGVLPPEHH